MIITPQDYINLALVLFVYGTVALLLISISAFVVNRFWPNPANNKVNKIIKTKQDKQKRYQKTA